MRAERDGGRQDAIQNNAAHMPREAPQVVLGDARTVGNAVQVHAFIAECRTDALQILHGKAGGEKARVVVQRLHAIERQPHERVGVCANAGPKNLPSEIVAMQWHRLAAAALVDQQHIALAQDARERGFALREETRRGIAGPTGNHNEWIRRRLLHECVHDSDEQRDALAFHRIRIQWHVEPAAIGFHFRAPFVGGDAASFQLQRAGTAAELQRRRDER